MKPLWDKYGQERGRGSIKLWLVGRAKGLVALLLLLFLVLSWTKLDPCSLAVCNPPFDEQRSYSR